MRSIKQDTFPIWSYSFVPRFSKWGSLFKARALDMSQVWELCRGLCWVTAARAWPHVPSCTHKGCAGRGQPCDLRKHTGGSSGWTGWPRVTHSAPGCPCEGAGLQKSHCHLHPWAVSPMFYHASPRIRDVGCLGAPALSLWPTVVAVCNYYEL